MHGQLTTVEFDSALQREQAIALISATVQKTRAMHGFQAAYYLDVDELHIVVVTIFDSEADLEAIRHEDDSLRRAAGKIGVRFLQASQYPVIAFAMTGAP